MLPKGYGQLGMINAMRCLAMNKEHKSQIVEYLDLIISTDTYLSDEEFDKYINEVLTEKGSNDNGRK